MKASLQPPWLARTLAAACLRGEAREVITGDLDQEFAESVAAGTPVAAARRRYWRQTLASLADVYRLSAGRVPGEPTMLRHWSSALFRGLSLDLRSVGRFAPPGYAAVAVLFLAMGIGATTVIFSPSASFRGAACDHPEIGSRLDACRGESIMTESAQFERLHDPANGVLSE